MFYRKSPRYLNFRSAKAIARSLPLGVGRVGVFVNERPAVVQETVEACGLDILQFHGEESPCYCLSFKPLKVIKAFRIKDASSLKQLEGYAELDAWLLDSYVKGQPGGTGEQFNWDLAVEAGAMGKRILLAGGLNPRNVADAVRKVRPWGVDVSSGVELRPGRKDSSAVHEFIKRVRAAED
jgi:phosphoribosylanthranilate isomerase